MIVLDTNVVSALMSTRAGDLDAWLSTVDGESLFTTAITRAEIRYGIARLPEGARRGCGRFPGPLHDSCRLR